MANILLIDDDVDLVEMNSMVLGARGHEVQAAYSAAEVPGVLQNFTPDAIIADCMMETLDAGIVLAHELKAELPDVPVIMLTGIGIASGGTIDLKQDADVLPVARILEKPIDPARLADEVEALVNETSA
jgi:CheY-like chemotaxis protein